MEKSDFEKLKKIAEEQYGKRFDKVTFDIFCKIIMGAVADKIASEKVRNALDVMENIMDTYGYKYENTGGGCCCFIKRHNARSIEISSELGLPASLKDKITVAFYRNDILGEVQEVSSLEMFINNIDEWEEYLY